MAIVGVGTDVVDVTRFARVLRRTPAVATRLFSDAERAGAAGADERLAARFAAKEAVAKALGTRSLGWHDAEVLPGPEGAPRLVVRGSVAAAAERAGVRRWHVSLSHDGGFAVAFVVAEG